MDDDVKFEKFTKVERFRSPVSSHMSRHSASKKTRGSDAASRKTGREVGGMRKRRLKRA